jgi:predicted Zn-ribbon and HTH transcriptional regulator
MAERIKKMKGPIDTGFECESCGFDYGKVKPKHCMKCGSYMIMKYNRLKNVKVNYPARTHNYDECLEIE